MAVASALETNPEAEIFLIEKNDGLGKKVIISGGGRCNVTTGIYDVRTVLTKYPRGGKFLSSAVYAFPPEAIFEWFEKHGVPLKTEGDLRVFPQSDDGEDVVRVFEEIFEKFSVNVILRATAEKIVKDGDSFAITLKRRQEPLIVDRVILTTGGQAYRQTGSTGDGYAFAVELGHSITSLAPSLSSLTSSETWPSEVSGLSFAKAKIYLKARTRTNAIGPMLFTHKGVSGPAVFAFSSLIAYEKFGPASALEIGVDIFPDLSLDELQKKILELISLEPKKQFDNVLASLIPKTLAGIAAAENKISPKRANEVSKMEITKTSTWLKNIPLHLVGRGSGDEFVTAGGVDLKEVNPKTMESLICPGLFFAGEILDIDGFTGGFNLTASWATGRSAGNSAGMGRGNS